MNGLKKFPKLQEEFIKNDYAKISQQLTEAMDQVDLLRVQENQLTTPFQELSNNLCILKNIYNTAGEVEQLFQKKLPGSVQKVIINKIHKNSELVLENSCKILNYLFSKQFEETYEHLDA